MFRTTPKVEEPKVYSVDLNVNVYERQTGQNRVSHSRSFEVSEPLTLAQLGEMLTRLANAMEMK